jgi:hypothetical protein
VRILLVAASLALADAAAAWPRLQAPWDKVDFRSSVDAIEKQFGATELADPCQGYGSWIVDGICFTINDRYADLAIEMQFPSVDAARKKLTKAWGRPAFRTGEGDDWTEHWHLTTGTRRVFATLTPYAGGARVDLEELLPVKTLLGAGPPDGIAGLLGLKRADVVAKYGRRAACGEGELCMIHFPATERGRAPVFADLGDGATVQRAHYVVWCGGPCLKSATLRAYAATLGRMTVSREGRRVTFAGAKPYVFDIGTEGGTWATVCTGACD